MKKKIIVLFLAACLACSILPLSGCTHKEEGADRRTHEGMEDDGGREWGSLTGSMLGGYAVGNTGVFYRNGDDLLQFTDAQTRQSSIVCDRSNCAHESYRQNEETECKADIHQFRTVIPQGDSVYLLGKDTEKDYSNYRIYRQDLNGDHREKAAELQDTMDLDIYECWANETYLVMQFQKVPVEGEGKQVDINEVTWGLLVYEWETGKLSNCILSESEMNQISRIETVEGMTFEKDGFSFCVVCQDAGYDLEQAEKLGEEKRLAYQREHEAIHYVKIRRGVYTIRFFQRRKALFTIMIPCCRNHFMSAMLQGLRWSAEA